MLAQICATSKRTCVRACHRARDPGGDFQSRGEFDTRPRGRIVNSMSIKIHWQEGLFLQPHHLQRMQKSVEDEVASERRLCWPYPFGVIEARLSRDELENKRVRFDKLRAIMPSGLEVNYPASAELPSLDIAQAFAKGAASFMISLGVPLWQNSRANTVPITQDAD